MREWERKRERLFELRNVYDKEVYDVTYLPLIIDYCMGTSDELSECEGERGKGLEMGEKEGKRINTIPERAMRSKVKQSEKDYFIYSICLCRSYGNAFFIIGEIFLWLRKLCCCYLHFAISLAGK